MIENEQRGRWPSRDGWRLGRCLVEEVRYASRQGESRRGRPDRHAPRAGAVEGGRARWDIVLRAEDPTCPGQRMLSLPLVRIQTDQRGVAARLEGGRPQGGRYRPGRGPGKA